MKAYEINTTAFDEENLIIFTDLTESQIKKVIEPIVLSEREDGEYYDNDVLLDALVDAYPKNEIYGYQNNPKLITI
jgi:hypothetical protein